MRKRPSFCIFPIALSVFLMLTIVADGMRQDSPQSRTARCLAASCQSEYGVALGSGLSIFVIDPFFSFFVVSFFSFCCVFLVSLCALFVLLSCCMWGRYREFAIS